MTRALFTIRTLTVTITSGPAPGSTTASTAATFLFRANATAVRFRCALDGRSYSSCASPASYTGLANGRHSFSVEATGAGITSGPASVAWTVAASSAPVIPPASSASGGGAPSVPTGLMASAGNERVVLAWKASSGRSGVAGYTVLRDGSPLAKVTATTYTDTAVSNGTTYTYNVEAYDSAGRTSAESAAVAATPSAPVTPPAPPSSGSVPPPNGTGPAPLTSWVPATGGLYTPLSDAQAAADVTAAPENRPGNAVPNAYMPTQAQLQAFYTAVDSNGQTVVQSNPYYAFVTGHYTGTTDEIIQWAAWKWGIPADWLRAQYVQESRWNMSQLGDEATVTTAEYDEYPAAARVPGSDDEVYQSMGISQIKWIPDGSVGAGTEPLRWESTAFNADYEAATIRFYYDNPDGLRSAWGDSSYAPGNAWDSLGGWYEPYPWLNAGQLSYIAEVQAQLANRTWAQPGF